jgi:hypothetical protein
MIQKVATRLAIPANEEKSDFTHFFLRNQEKDPLNEKELQTNADILVVAGSETTATVGVLRAPIPCFISFWEVHQTSWNSRDMVHMILKTDFLLLNASLKK